jgi:hypothetical protein
MLTTPPTPPDCDPVVRTGDSENRHWRLPAMAGLARRGPQTDSGALEPTRQMTAPCRAPSQPHTLSVSPEPSPQYSEPPPPYAGIGDRG